MRALFFILSGVSILTSINAYADYFDVQAPPSVKSYNFSAVSIPDTVGATTNDLDGNAFMYTIHYSETMGATLGLKVNGTLLGDGKTYATNNPGVGIQYTFHLMKTQGLSPTGDIKAPPFVYTSVGHGTDDGVITSQSLNVWYRLVRISEFVPSGAITTVPDVSYIITNPAGEGEPVITGTILSGMGAQPKVVACTINAPTEIKLSPLYGKDIRAGALNVTDAQKITLTNCPGAINGIDYNFSASYGTNGAAIGVLKTATGEGYAKEVYVQIQNADGTPHIINGVIPLEGYNGSGDYAIPDFKVAYYVYDPSIVTAGKVKSAIELKVTYN
ncbi:type 1 fimbrial protein [Salmonella enterica subsp. enterica]|uniref:fimbrial protein n=1 Tax=Salmonella enterica TaxID=28901 RepID=UPI000FBF7067|nr:fimbrial protein [Salmonella enterica]ECH9425897.1 type 1 fimbrial protein [Salmonella enterica subsp. enterica]EAC1130747.1 type 1 fimbrial protein [Salmonella enterica subsp. enterica serovar Kambole]EBG0731149.1 fimbrial protein [Salmonella enterica subsp. enterica serovar Kambole]EBS2655208.1 type 1 fimbrial protein [Salmonella enterica subsp. enterica serovar Kambole]EBY4016856.1 type 1 fimbrial protein [Salmonella enterica subsp. enterica serovar Kambole]